MQQRTDDIRIKWTKVVLPPVFLDEEMPATEKSLATFILPVVPVVRVVVATPIPSPICRFLKFQSVFPPKLPVPSKRKVPLVRLMMPLPVASPPLTLIEFVPASVPAA